jgi:integrase/recombinase XerD
LQQGLGQENIDLENDLIRLQVTKNKKARYIPISTMLKNVLMEFLPLRQSNSDDDDLFPNIYGDMLPRSTLQMTITRYCQKRGIEKYSLHLFRHCFATNYLRAGG